jgi:hypothetical protein
MRYDAAPTISRKPAVDPRGGHSTVCESVWYPHKSVFSHVVYPRPRQRRTPTRRDVPGSAVDVPADGRGPNERATVNGTRARAAPARRRARRSLHLEMDFDLR